MYNCQKKYSIKGAGKNIFFILIKIKIFKIISKYLIKIKFEIKLKK